MSIEYVTICLSAENFFLKIEQLPKCLTVVNIAGV